ncbi:conserved hypothetical protein [Micromonospora lupini str. Lupac 08]|uniref:Uncharacterized protein n=1 Tax=Micromonospora lupini str. Lupac 08 TaxID=1150864 RepID=I0L1N0_9ACTN|nr:conserved hypothetical protein [Micromonospora lupini str. Lupac 08]
MPARPAVHTIVVCLPTDATPQSMPALAATRLVAQQFRPAGPVGHFAAHHRLTRQLLHRYQGYAAGGPVRHLDLAGMRARAATSAVWLWHRWRDVIDGTRDAQPLSAFVDRHRDEPARWPLSRAQQAYLAQPRVLAMTTYNAAYRRQPIPIADIEALQVGLNSYRTLAALAAVPGDALAADAANWLTPRSGRLADQLDYLYAANDHIDRLRPNEQLVAMAAWPLA